MLSVLHLCPRFFPQRGGSETYTGSLITELIVTGIANQVLAAGKPESDYLWNGISVSRADDIVTNTISGRSQYVERFESLLNTNHIDVVHWHFLPEQTDVMLDLCKVKHIRTVHTLHHPKALCIRADLRRFGSELCDRTPNRANCVPCMAHFHGMPRALAKGYRAFTTMMPSQFVAMLPSSRLKTSLQLDEKIGARIERTKALLNRFDATIALSVASIAVLERSGVDRRQIRLSRLGTHHGTPKRVDWIDWREANRPMRVMFVGRLDRVKGVVELAEAAGSFSASELCLDIYGPPGDATEALVKIAGTGSTSVRYLGALADEDVVDLMTEYDFVAIPSSTFETGPFTAVEALQAGTPILGSDTPSLNEFIETGENGFLVQFPSPEAWRNTLRSALEQPALFSRFRSELTYRRTMRDVATEMCQEYRALQRTISFESSATSSSS